MQPLPLAPQVYMGTVVELVRRECDNLQLELSDMLLKLELPAPKDSSTWEQRGPVTGVGQARACTPRWLGASCAAALALGSRVLQL